MSTKIKTLFVRWTAIYLIIFAILHIHDAKLTNFQKYYIIVWKLIIISFVVYAFSFGDPFLVTVGESVTYAGKPLVKTFDQFEATFSYPISCLTTVFYFHIFGQQIIEFLDKLGCMAIKHVNNQKEVTAAYYIFVHSLFAIGYGSLCFKYIQFGRFLNQPICSLINWLAMYIQFLTHILPLTCCHFVHHCLLKSVIDISQNCHHYKSSEICNKLKIYSDLNNQINTFLSVPLLLFTFSNTANSIVCTILLSTDKEYGIFTFVVLIFIYQLYIVCFPNYTRNVLTKISKRKLCLSQKNMHHSIVYSELLCYEKYFNLKIFNMKCLDQNFVVALALFILNYCIILLQTKE